MTEVQEIPEGQTVLAAEALLALRPRWKTAAAITELVDRRLRPDGYRVVGEFDGDTESDRGEHSAVSVIGFRQSWSSAWGHYVYVEDLSTVESARGRGFADQLLAWVMGEARRLDCEAVHLDSGVGSHRAAAHRLYFRNHMQIASHHFSITL